MMVALAVEKSTLTSPFQEAYLLCKSDDCILFITRYTKFVHSHLTN